MPLSHRGIHVLTCMQRFYLPDNSSELFPTRKGITLTLSEWQILKEHCDVMSSKAPELRDAVRCINREDHQNQLGALDCAECNPN